MAYLAGGRGPDNNNNGTVQRIWIVSKGEDFEEKVVLQIFTTHPRAVQFAEEFVSNLDPSIRPERIASTHWSKGGLYVDIEEQILN